MPLPQLRSLPRPSSYKAFLRFSRPLTLTDAQYPILRNALHVSPIVPTVRRERMPDIRCERNGGGDGDEYCEKFQEIGDLPRVRELPQMSFQLTAIGA